jgi:predicted nucleic acid-binding protein
MKKPSIYLDTTVFSAYWYEGHDVYSIARRLKTREWWIEDKHEFAVWTSLVTLRELKAGSYPRQEDAREMARPIRLLPINRKVTDLSARLVSAGIVPKSKPNDAMQMALASVHQIDYLLTWN